MDAVAEVPLWIALNGTRRIILSCSPHEPGALALGHLLGEGWITRVDDIDTFCVVDGGVEFTLDAARVAAADALRQHQLSHGCGPRHFLDCEPDALPRVRAAAAPRAVAALLRALFSAVPAGGVHAAAFSDGAALLHHTTDVARHCAADRIIGVAALAGEPDGGGLVLTSRVSGAIALKAARAGIGWIASRSVATTLAAEICAAAGIALYERAGRAS